MSLVALFSRFGSTAFTLIFKRFPMMLDIIIKSGMQEGDLVFGVVAAVEEEKDPRCLLLSFRIIQLLARLYPDPSGPVASCAEELFDVVSRYFPISFNPVSILRRSLFFIATFSFSCVWVIKSKLTELSASWFFWGFEKVVVDYYQKGRLDVAMLLRLQDLFLR
jgi:hypothetical protein